MKAEFEHLNSLGYSPFVPSDGNEGASFDKLAQVVGRPLPAPYLEFLHACPSTGLFRLDEGAAASAFDEAGKPRAESYPIDMLYAACSDKRYDLLELAAHQRETHEELPGHLLVVGDDTFGNLYCIDLQEGDRFGRVYYVDHERSRDVSGLRLVGRDFMEFLGGLRLAT